MASSHEWDLVGDPPELAAMLVRMYDGVSDGSPRKSDVHMCKRCGQVALSHVGMPVEGKVTDAYLQPCEEVMVRLVMTS